MIFGQILEAWNQHQVIAKQGKTPDSKPDGRGFGVDVSKLHLPARGAPSPYGEPNRSNSSQTTMGQK